MTKEVLLRRVSRTYPKLLDNMKRHYSQPKGFVGRNICYAVTHEDNYFGAIVGGSATRHLPGRQSGLPLNNIVNNIFFHIEGPYPFYNFSQSVLRSYREAIERDWTDKYGDRVLLHETLVELPRTGLVYLRDGWKLVGQTKGYTCKRTAGKGTDSWSGKRVWNTVNLRPKHVFVREAAQ